MPAPDPARTEEDPVIEARDLAVAFGDLLVLEEVDLAVSRGEVFTILGPSGCGKTTLLRCLIGAVRPSEGTVRLQGRNVHELDHEELRDLQADLGMLYQHSALFNSMTVGENVALPLREHTDLPGEVIRGMVRLKLGLVDMAEHEGQMPGELSGGMRKRAALARAMARDPSILFLDEPTTGLDPITAADLDRLILDFSQAFDQTMVIVTHDLDTAFGCSDRLVLLRDGRIVAAGRPMDLLASSDPWVRRFVHREPVGDLDEEPGGPIGGGVRTDADGRA